MSAVSYNPRVTPWEISESDFAATRSPEEQARFLLRYAILAPSTHNTQPWKFEIDATPPRVVAFADYDRRLPVVDRDDRELLMTIGAALFNFQVAAAHYGLAAAVTPWPNAATPGRRARGGCEAVAVAGLEPGPGDAGLASLFPAILRRRTNRLPYDTRPLDPRARAGLETAGASGAGLRLLSGGADQATLAGLIARGDRLQMGDPAFRKELAGWVRPNAAGTGDGVAGDGFGVPDLLSWGGSWFIRSLDLGGFQSRRDERAAREAPALVVIYGPDDVPGLLAAGQLLQRTLLAATALGLQCAFLNQPIEVPELRPVTRTVLGLLDPAWPQILLRVGYGPDVPRSMPRRPLDQVMVG